MNHKQWNFPGWYTEKLRQFKRAHTGEYVSKVLLIETLILFKQLDSLWEQKFKDIKESNPEVTSYEGLHDWTQGTLDNVNMKAVLSTNAITLLHVLFHATEQVKCRRCGWVSNWPGKRTEIRREKYINIQRTCCNVSPNLAFEW